MIKHIVAYHRCDLGYVIGYQNKLLWHYKEDLKFFNNITQNKTLIVGSNTYLSIRSYAKDVNNLLPNRKLLVVTSKKPSFYNELSKNVSFISASEINNYVHDEDTYIIGGSKLYNSYKPDLIIANNIKTLTSIYKPNNNYSFYLDGDFKSQYDQIYSYQLSDQVESTLLIRKNFKS